MSAKEGEVGDGVLEVDADADCERVCELFLNQRKTGSSPALDPSSTYSVVCKNLALLDDVRVCAYGCDPPGCTFHILELEAFIAANEVLESADIIDTVAERAATETCAWCHIPFEILVLSCRGTAVVDESLFSSRWNFGEEGVGGLSLDIACSMDVGHGVFLVLVVRRT